MSVFHRAPQPSFAARSTLRLGVSSQVACSPAAPARRVPALPPSGAPRRYLALLIVLGLGASACSELQARRHARSGNTHYRDGDYAGAVREYEESERYYDGLQVVALNKGLACRQMMLPGSKTPENEKAVDCALEAFSRAKQITPDDARGDQLYVQTLFDADRYETLAKMYQDQLSKNDRDLAAINGLVTVYSRSNDWREALKWTARRADIESHDAEAQYGVGVLIHNLLFQKGGGDKSSYNPWPDPNVDPKKAEPKVPPPFGSEDIVADERIALSDQGIEYLKKATAIRTEYKEAMVYVNLIYRQKSLAYLDNPAEWQKCIDEAERWRNRALPGGAPAAPPPAAEPSDDTKEASPG
jgi:tetratricopeptide (TPR) repeat protein